MSTEEAKVKLYWLEQSRSQRILWLLEELKVKYEVEIFHRNKQTFLAPPELEKVHPLGKSPVITITPAGADAKPIVLAESGWMTEYLCTHYPEGQRLVPKRWQEGKENTIGGETEAYMRYKYYLHYAEGTLMPYLVLSLVIGRLKGGDIPFFVRPITSIVANRIISLFIAPNIKKNLAMLNDQLSTSGGKYLCYDQLTAADILMSFPLLAAKGRFTEIVPGWEKTYPRVVEYIKTLESNPGYKKSIAKVEELDGKFQASLRLTAGVMIPPRVVCWRCTSRLRTQARQPVAKLAYSSLADTDSKIQPAHTSQSTPKQRIRPRIRDGTPETNRASLLPTYGSDAPAYDMFNQIVNGRKSEWTGKPAALSTAPETSGMRAHEIDLTFLLSTLVARRTEPVMTRLKTFEESIWPLLRPYGTDLPAPISHLLHEFIKDACVDSIQNSRATACREIAQVADRVGMKQPHIPNVMALKLCHACVTSKNTTAQRKFLAQSLLDLWMHVSQMQRLPEKDRPLRLALPDKVDFKVALRASPGSRDGVPGDRIATPESFLDALFPQFKDGRARDLMDGLLATLCLVSDPRFVTEHVQRDFAPLLELASIFVNEHSQQAELMLQQYPHQVSHAVAFPSEKFDELGVYIRNQWPLLVQFLNNKKAAWRQGSAPADDSKASLAQIHRRFRRAYEGRNKPGVSTIFAELHERQASSPDLRSAIQSRPELMDFIIFITCALRLDYEYKTAVELMKELHIPLTLKTYTGMMHGWRLCKDFRKIDALWNQLQVANVRLDVPIWTERLAAYILKGKIGVCMTELAKLQADWNAAVENKTVEESGAVQPSIEMVNACIKGTLEISPRSAKVLLSWAHNNGIKPDISTHNIILRHAFGTGPEDVAWIMDLMEKNGIEPNQATFVILIEEMLSLTGPESPEAQVEAVDQVFAELSRSKFALNPELYAKALHAVASMANASNAAVDAVLAHLRHQNVRINPYMVTILIERSLQRDPHSFAPVEALLHKYDMADTSRGDQTLWERVIRAAAITGEPYVALRRFDELAAAGRPVTSLPCLNELLRALLAEGDAANARRIVDSVLHNKMLAQMQRGGETDVDEARFWKHHFWYLAKENNLLDDANMPGGLHKLIEHY
ncbi:hypothetical protein MY4038_005566 [Beauveria bassiana]